MYTPRDDVPDSVEKILVDEECDVRQWNDDRDLGFIVSRSDGASVFMHASALRRGDVLQSGDVVTFTIGSGSGLCAASR